MEDGDDYPPSVVEQSPILNYQDNKYNISDSDSSVNDRNDGIFADLLGGVYMIYRHEYLQLVLAVSVLYKIAMTCMHILGLDCFGSGEGGSGTSGSSNIVDNNGPEFLNVSRATRRTCRWLSVELIIINTLIIVDIFTLLR